MMDEVFVTGRVRVRVPATSANLGPGFDSLGLALGLYDEVTAHVGGSGLSIEVHGEGSVDVARDETHLVVGSMRRAFDLLGVPVPGLVIDCANRIPHSRGLGSSAAAIVSGILLARGLVVDGATRLTDADVLALANEIEGHPDNVAPCLLGGLTVAWIAGGAARAVRRDVDPAVVPAVLVPLRTASTELARGLLPVTVPHADAAFTAGRAALLVAALTGTPQALFDATEDRLHQSFRAAAMPETAQLVDTLRAEGHPAVISGAGPTVLVLTRGEVETEQIRDQAPEGWAFSVLPVDADGARIVSSR